MRTTTLTNVPTPSPLTVSWDQVLDGDLPHPLPPQVTRLVHEATAAAKAALPALHERLDRARDLVLAGAVSLNDDGSFTVTSQSRRGTSYRIAGACPCQGAVHEPRCKHLLATWIWRKAQASLATEEGTPPAPLTPVPSPLPEAASSVNVDLHIGGRLVRLTLRDHDEQRLLARLDTVLQRFPLAEAVRPAQAHPVTPAASATTAAEGWCPLHGCAMTQHTNAKGSWWSHKLADGTWCRGKAQA